MKEEFRLQRLVLAVGIGILAIKTLAFWLTASNAILSDALESVVNVAAGALALYSLWFSAQPSDADHPYGHGKIEFLTSGVEGVLIILAGMAIVGKAIYNFFYPQTIQNLDIGLWLSLLGGSTNFVLGFLLLRLGNKRNSLVLKSEGHHLMSDAWSTLALVVGITVVYFTNWLWLDNLIAMGFGIAIAWVGIKVIRKSLSGILDETDSGLLNTLLNALRTQPKPEWINLHNLRVQRFGRNLHFDAHLTLPWYLHLKDAHKSMHELEERVSQMLQVPVEISLHLDPCKPIHCSSCLVAECAYRVEAFQKAFSWELKEVADQPNQPKLAQI